MNKKASEPKCAMTGLFNPIRITFDIDPVAKGRPRFTRNGHCYTPPETRQYEATLKWLWKKEGHGMIPAGVPIHLTAGFFVKRPKSAPKTRLLPVVKPDVDNFLKAVKDALNGLAWADDSQVTDAWPYKRYAEEGRIEIVIAPVILAGVA